MSVNRYKVNRYKVNKREFWFLPLRNYLTIDGLLDRVWYRRLIISGQLYIEVITY